MMQYVLLVAAVFAVSLAKHGHHDPCQICEFVVKTAEHHFHNNVTDETALKAQMLIECQHLGKNQGQDVAQACSDMVSTNIDKIFADIQAGDRSHETCFDIGQCVRPTKGPGPSVMPSGMPTGMPARQPSRLFVKGKKEEHNECRTCDLILNIAEHYFHNNVNDEAALKTQLEAECVRLGQHEGPAAAAQCKENVEQNMDQIYNDLKAGKKPHQTCIDIGDCQQEK